MKKNIFVHIPKTAGNSVREGLGVVPNVVDIGHSTLKNQKLLGKDIYSFCFVREPYKRLRSAFYHLSDLEHSSGKETSKFQNRRVKLVKEYGGDFKSFVTDRGYEKFKFAHFYPQTFWTHQNGAQIVDFIGRLETINEDWMKLSDALGVKLLPLKKKNSTTVSSYNSKETLNKSHMNEIVDFYIRDYVYLGYDF